MTIRRFPHSRQSTIPYPATLDLSFIGRDTLDPRITFARSDATTCATYFDSAGVLQTVATNIPRFDYNPATLAARGLLIEEQRANLLLRSADFATTWAPTAATISANATASPDGGTNGDKLAETAVTSEHYVRQFLTGLTANTTYTISVFVTAAERTRFRIRALDTDIPTNGYVANFDLSAVTASGFGAGAGSIIGTPTTTSVGNGWFRCVVSGNAVTGTKYIVDYFVLNAAGASSYLGVLGEGIFLWGAQLEAGAFPTSYIPTTTTAVTRAADVASITELAPWYNASSGTLSAEFSAPASGTRTMADLNDTTATESIRLRTVSTNPFFTVTDGTDQADIDAGTVASNTVYKFAGAYAANDFATCINGGTVQTDNSGTLPAITQMLLGADASGNALNGYLRRLTYYPVRLSNTDLQAITA